MNPIGVLGGMGPYATCLFFQKVLELSKSHDDIDYPHLLIDSNNKIPSRTRHVLYGEESPVQGMIESIRAMELFGVTEVSIPCNSACFFLPEITAHVKTKVHNTIEITVNALAHINSRFITVFGGYITIDKEAYRPYVKDYGNYIKPNPYVNTQVDKLIYMIKRQENQNETKKLAQNILSQLSGKIDTVILACTELCAVFDHCSSNITIVDSNYELAKHLVKKYKQNIQKELGYHE